MKRQDSREVKFKLKGYTPKTLPMLRLAQYMLEFSRLIGHQDHVHFEDLREGSAEICAVVEGPGVHSKVVARISGVQNGTAPKDALAAYGRLNQMLRKDDANAELKASSTVIRLRAANVNIVSAIVQDYGDITGKLYFLAESKKGVSAKVKPFSGGKPVTCTAPNSMKNDLRGLLFEPVRVSGRGLWERKQGLWECDALHIEQVQAVEMVSFRAAIGKLRNTKVEWPEDPLAELAALEDDMAALDDALETA